MIFLEIEQYEKYKNNYYYKKYEEVLYELLKNRSLVICNKLYKCGHEHIILYELKNGFETQTFYIGKSEDEVFAELFGYYDLFIKSFS